MSPKKTDGKISLRVAFLSIGNLPLNSKIKNSKAVEARDDQTKSWIKLKWLSVYLKADAAVPQKRMVNPAYR